MILNLECKRNLYFCISLLFSSYLLAHKPNEAFFTITTNSDYTEIVAELPWSVRNDLILFNPDLEKSNNDQDFVIAFEKYIQQKLILRNQSGKQMQLISVREENHNGHSHQNNFRIRYQGSELLEIKNTILFTSYKDQKNYHFLNLENQKLTYITDSDSSSITFDETKYTESVCSKYWITIPLLLFSVLGVIYFKRNYSYK